MEPARKEREGQRMGRCEGQRPRCRFGLIKLVFCLLQTVEYIRRSSKNDFAAWCNFQPMRRAIDQWQPAPLLQCPDSSPDSWLSDVSFLGGTREIECFRQGDQIRHSRSDVSGRAFPLLTTSACRDWPRGAGSCLTDCHSHHVALTCINAMICTIVRKCKGGVKIAPRCCQ